MADKNYVTMYTKVRCDMGCMDNYLNVDIDHGVYKIGEDGEIYPVLNAGDILVPQNIPSFGKCSSPVNPDYNKQGFRKKLMQNIKNFFNHDGTCECVPEIKTKWQYGNSPNQLAHNDCLTEDCRLACTKGGIISIVTEHGEE